MPPFIPVLLFLLGLVLGVFGYPVPADIVIVLAVCLSASTLILDALRYRRRHLRQDGSDCRCMNGSHLRHATALEEQAQEKHHQRVREHAQGQQCSGAEF